MIEIELFYKIVEASIREKHTYYLETEKRTAIPIIIPQVDDLPVGSAWKQLKRAERKALKRKRKQQIKDRKKAERKSKKILVEDKLLKGYNKGIKISLSVLSKEFKRYEKRLKKEEKDGRKF